MAGGGGGGAGGGRGGRQDEHPPAVLTSPPEIEERAAYDAVMAARLTRKSSPATVVMCMARLKATAKKAKSVVAARTERRAAAIAAGRRASATDEAKSAANDATKADAAAAAAAARLPESTPSLKPHLTREESIEEGKHLLDQRLTFLSLVQKPSVDDGNCLFRSISTELWNTQEHHYFIRLEAVKWMEEHVEEYQVYVGGESDWASYLSKMKMDRTVIAHLQTPTHPSPPIHTPAYTCKPYAAHDDA